LPDGQRGRKDYLNLLSEKSGKFDRLVHEKNSPEKAEKTNPSSNARERFYPLMSGYALNEIVERTWQEL